MKENSFENVNSSDHSSWVAREGKELAKSALVAGVALPIVYGALQLVSPELAGSGFGPEFYGAVVAIDYLRRKQKNNE